MTLMMQAAEYAAKAAHEDFAGRYGHGSQKTPIVYRQMRQRELAVLLKGAYLAGAAAANRPAKQK
jgi:hypothetical protein